MYKKGDLKLVDPPCSSYNREEDVLMCVDPTHVHLVDDARNVEECISAPCVYLPHSCDEWVIGGMENVRQMIEDLQVAFFQLSKQ